MIVGREDSELLAEAVALGNEDKRTLGFLPHQAYEQACANGTLIAAVEDGHVLAYALYSLPRQVVRLTHLCVSREARGRGLARLLASAAFLTYQDDGNLVAYCLYPGGNTYAFWASNTQGATGGPNGNAILDFQNDGNLVIYSNGIAIWSTKTYNHPNDYAVFQNDDNFVIYDGSTPLWSTNTYGLGGCLQRLRLEPEANLLAASPLATGGRQPPHPANGP